MNEQLESILNKAPNLYDGEYYNLRNDSVANYIEDLEYQLYVFDEDEIVENAKQKYDWVRKNNVSKYTLMSVKREYEDVKKEYAELKKHLKYVKKRSN